MCAASTTRVRGLARWYPKTETHYLLAKVRSVLNEYNSYLPLTVRQIFYRLVGAHGYEKTERAYTRLAEMMNRARRAGMVPFEAIRDDGTTMSKPDAWEDGSQLIGTFIDAAQRFRLDRQLGQPVRLLFAVEALGMLPQVQRVTDHFGIGVHSSGGFDSVTAKYDLARRLGEWPQVEVLHIGDHDPSGVHLFSSMAEDVRQIACDLKLGSEITFTRLAVTPEQIASMGLPTAPAKETDRRAFTGETVQCEAIPPDTLADIVRSAILARHDVEAFKKVLRAEVTTRTELEDRLSVLRA